MSGTDKNLIPRFVLEHRIPDPPVIVDRLTGVPTYVTNDPAEIVAAMVRLDITTLEVDTTGVGNAIFQGLQEWGGITVVGRNRAVVHA